MYIEDSSKPFLTIEHTPLTEEEFVAARKYAAKYFGLGRINAALGIIMLLLAVCSGLSFILLVSQNNAAFFPIDKLAMTIFALAAGYIFACVLPKETTDFSKKIYNTTPFLTQTRTISFYKEFFEWKSQNEYVKIYRTDIEKCLETTEMFLLKRKDNKLLIVYKRVCSEDNILLLREYLKSVYVNHYQAVK